MQADDTRIVTKIASLGAELGMSACTYSVGAKMMGAMRRFGRHRCCERTMTLFPTLEWLR
ncbi:hypothetical protein HMPREF1248_0968 [Coriobacteriaceae bacterium BV3Ac1]|nr:hypothetical protein HMPREF1248_0968 [Coriobacteriaceae bacterium BV3Ac1]